MRFSIKIIESDKEIALRIGNALIPQVRQYMSKTMDKIRKGLPDIIYQAIISSPEYSSILSGLLKYEFGIPDSLSKLDGLLNVWTQNLSVTYTPPLVNYNGSVSSSVTIAMIKSDFSDVLGTDYASVVDRKRGYILPWLSWLLLEGSVTIVNGHQVIFGSNPRSRTGLAVMRKGGNGWKVPKRFAGTSNDNWITRAIASSEKDIYNFIQKAMKI